MKRVAFPEILRPELTQTLGPDSCAAVPLYCVPETSKATWWMNSEPMTAAMPQSMMSHQIQSGQLKQAAFRFGDGCGK